MLYYQTYLGWLMGIYEKYWYKTEGINRIKNNLINTKYTIKIYSYVSKKYGIETAKKLYKDFDKNITKRLIFGLWLFDENLVNWIKNNIINKLNKESILGSFIELLNNTLTTKDETLRNIYIKSLKQSGLVKDIEYKKYHYIITLLDDKKIKISNIITKEETIDKIEGKCHLLAHEYILKHNKPNIYLVTILEPSMYGLDMYHSFIVDNDYVIDYTRNILMKYEDYINTLKPNIIICKERNEILSDIDKLRNDKTFKNDSTEDILKYALHKRIYKEV